jgi:VWFA-related protein
MRLPVRALVVVAGFAGGVAQQPAPVFRSGIDVVQLDVSVLDKRRQPIRGLKAEDFTVLEDGKSQRIVAVSEMTHEGATVQRPVWGRAATPDVASNDVGDRRIFAIVIDGPGPNVPDLFRGVMDRLIPGDVVAVVGGGCYVPFTEDLEKLYACLESMQRSGPRPRTPLPPARSPLERPHHILRDVAEYMTAVPQRRKAILYIGSGFTFGSGRAAGPLQEDYRETLWFAHLANVNIYTFSSGLNLAFSNRSSRGSTYSQMSGLADLAEDTGGVLTRPDRLDEGLDQMFLENSHYYLVGYQSSHPQMDGKFRRLSVKVNRPDVMVRTRSRWYRPKATRTDGVSTAAVPSQALTGRLRDWMPSLDVTFNAAAMPFAQPGTNDAAIAIVAGLAEPVIFGVTRVVQRMDLRVLAYDESGKTVIDVSRRVQIDTPPSSESRVMYDVLQQIALPPGHYNFRLVAHNADTDKLGAIEFALTVPDFHRDAISLSGVAIAASSAEPMATVGSLEPIVPVVPTAIRKFLSRDRVSAFARVYQGGEGPPTAATLDIRILDAQGAPVYSSTDSIAAARFASSRSVEIRLDLPMTPLKAGTYLLTLQATRGARKTLPRDVRFVVR